MNIEKRLGKLANVRFGWGGYQECMFGLSVSIEMDGSGVGDFRGPWGIDRSDGAKWTEADRREEMADTMFYVRDLLKDANKMGVEELNGVPVEVTFDGNRLVKWRILTEVL